MGPAVTIATPLGPLEIAVEVDGAPEGGPPRRSRLDGGAEVVVWSDVGGLVVDALVTPVTPFADAPMDLPETRMWGVEWRLHAATDTCDLTISALLAESDGVAPSSLGGDEDLLIAEFCTADWVLAVGGPDEEFLSRLADEGRQPASWRALLPPVDDPAGGRGLAWRLPALSAGGTGRVHVAVAWCRTGHPRSDDAPGLAVDTSPAALRIAAGVATPHELRRAARGT